LRALKICVVDNYDSFTYNLVHYLEDITGALPMVFTNDIEDLSVLEDFDLLVLSPGPGLPDKAGRLMEIIERYVDSKPMLGICLGHQALAIHFGGELINLSRLFHGDQDRLTVLASEKGLYSDVELPVLVGRYHSWVVNSATFPKNLSCTAISSDNQVMSFEHKNLPVIGLQYHPESILTPQGKTILSAAVHQLFEFHE
jgi:anthranilate synthase component II